MALGNSMKAAVLAALAVGWAAGCSGSTFESTGQKGGTGGTSGDSGSGGSGTGGTGGDVSPAGGSSGTNAGKGGSSGSSARGGTSGKAGKGGGTTGGTSGTSGTGGDAGTAGNAASGGTGGGTGGSGNGGSANAGTGGTGGSFPCVSGGECGADGDHCQMGTCCPCSLTCKDGTWGPLLCAQCVAPACPVDAPVDGSACSACQVPNEPCQYAMCPVDGPLTTAACVDDHWVVTVDNSCVSSACCTGNGDCADHHCISGVCKDDDARGCWGDDQCGSEQVCSGIWVCPCNADCDGFDEPGTCVPKSGNCCIDDNDCKSSGTCLRGVCKAPTPDGCWADRDCVGGTCEGESICGCGMDCLLADKPGMCVIPL